MNAPPKTLAARLRKAASPAIEPVPAMDLPQKRPAASPTPRQPDVPETSQDNLPVLEAFQRFLDAERRKTRRRLLAVSLSFLVVLTAIVGGATFMGVAFFAELRRDFDDIENSVARTRDNNLRIQEDAEKTLKAVEKQRHEIMADYENEKKSLSTAQSEIESQMRSHTTALDEIKAMVATLKSENSLLKKTIARIAQPVGAATKPLARAVTAPAAPSNTVAGSADTTQEPVLDLAVAVGTEEQQVNWRIPIPE